MLTGVLLIFRQKQWVFELKAILSGYNYGAGSSLCHSMTYAS